MHIAITVVLHFHTIIQLQIIVFKVISFIICFYW